ncbi:MAG: O-antigen ligase family protein [Clostridium sp.]|nr:O-antigen ligase family protein [Acetatifactor muris]MCM1528301.1 O-antigen ligase family protein [Bacteroides sp.]MCM1563677.1 O-antigen ligase family protein [Clostridium sp.]
MMDSGLEGKAAMRGAQKDEQGLPQGEIRAMLTAVYIMLLFLMFPLYVEDGYGAMGFCKWRFYCYITVPYVTVMSLLALPDLMRGFRARRKPVIGVCDLLAGAYGVCVLIGWWLCDDRQAALWGAEGWHMGVVTQLLLVASYFVISRNPAQISWIVGCNAIGSGICFLIGIFQRLGWDILRLYKNVDAGQVRNFFSTIGNRTWFSGYACAVFPIGVYLYWQACAQAPERAKRQRLCWGIYSGVAFAGLAAAYSDSAYIGLTVVLAALFILSVGHVRKTEAFFRVLCLWFGSALLMGIVRKLCGERIVDAYKLSRYVYDLRYGAVGLALCAALTIAVRVWNARSPAREENDGRRGRLQRRCLLCMMLGAAMAIGFVVLNTTGVLEDLFHVTFQNRYLYFDDDWGDLRGCIWRMVCGLYGELPVCHKLFGVGADSLAAHIYGNPEYARLFGAVWGNHILTNAHNEWLNMWICQGAVGGLVYMAVFAGGIIACLCGGGNRLESSAGVAADRLEPSAGVAADRLEPSAGVAADLSEPSVNAAADLSEPFVRAVGICLLAYCAHNFLCYQQICATGPVFVLLGAAMSGLRSKR